QVYCSTDQAIAHPAAEVNKGGAPGWVYSIFYVHDSATGRWTTTNWIISYGGAGWQPSYYWMGDHWQQIDARGVVFRATPGSTQTFYELRYTQSPMIAHSNTWTYEWVYGGQCSTNLQRPWCSLTLAEPPAADDPPFGAGRLHFPGPEDRTDA